MPTREQYEAAFEIERAHEYPVIDEFERRMGFAVDRERLEAAARVLACPVKKNPPNWQHGRVIYALLRSYLASGGSSEFWLDIGTAKGFSACVMAWVASDAQTAGNILSLDIIRPTSNEPRNSILDGEITQGIRSFTEPFLPAGECNFTITFSQAGDEGILPDHIGFAFVDGSHTYEGVGANIATVTPRQQPGDIIMFDDIQVPGVAKAVSEMEGYAIEYIDLLPKRKYAIAVKQ